MDQFTRGSHWKDAGGMLVVRGRPKEGEVGIPQPHRGYEQELEITDPRVQKRTGLILIGSQDFETYHFWNRGRIIQFDGHVAQQKLNRNSEKLETIPREDRLCHEGLEYAVL